MKLSPQQQKAVRGLTDFLSSGQQIYKIHGYAGTGKSTVISHVLGGRDDIVFCAPTAKAASVLRSKGTEAVTIHSLLYTPYEYVHPRTKKPTLGFKENPKSPLAAGGIVVVDEASMVDAQIAEDLLRHPVKVIAIGDPGQLPPVMSKGNQSLLSGRPDVMLTEVHRTALDSPILELATYVRENKKLPPWEFNKPGGRIVRHSSEAGEFTSFDQIIVGRHKTRFRVNDFVRRQRGFQGSFPNAGETVLCKMNKIDKGLINGAQYTVRSSMKVDEDSLIVDLVAEDGTIIPETAWTYGFLGARGMEHLARMPMNDRKENLILWHSEAITCHSSQGSEWGKVLVNDESRSFNTPGPWLYTALTRAQEEVVIVR